MSVKTARGSIKHAGFTETKNFCINVDIAVSNYQCGFALAPHIFVMHAIGNVIKRAINALVRGDVYLGGTMRQMGRRLLLGARSA